MQVPTPLCQNEADVALVHINRHRSLIDTIIRPLCFLTTTSCHISHSSNPVLSNINPHIPIIHLTHPLDTFHVRLSSSGLGLPSLSRSVSAAAYGRGNNHPRSITARCVLDGPSSFLTQVHATTQAHRSFADLARRQMCPTCCARGVAARLRPLQSISFWVAVCMCVRVFVCVRARVCACGCVDGLKAVIMGMQSWDATTGVIACLCWARRMLAVHTHTSCFRSC